MTQAQLHTHTLIYIYLYLYVAHVFYKTRFQTPSHGESGPSRGKGVLIAYPPLVALLGSGNPSRDPPKRGKVGLGHGAPLLPIAPLSSDLS